MTKKYLLGLAAMVPLYFFVIQLSEKSTKPLIHTNNTEPRTIEWVDLMPNEDLTFTEPTTGNAPNVEPPIEPPIEHHLPQSTNNSRFEKTLTDAIAEAKKPVKSPLKALIRSYTIRHEYNYIKIKLAGYIVPLEFNEQKITTAFFLVPYYGACIHVPPPPPNQIIYVRIPQVINISDIYNPYWVTGILKAETTTKENGVSAYILDAERVTEYTEH